MLGKSLWLGLSLFWGASAYAQFSVKTSVAVEACDPDDYDAFMRSHTTSVIAPENQKSTLEKTPITGEFLWGSQVHGRFGFAQACTQAGPGKVCVTQDYTTQVMPDFPKGQLTSLPILKLKIGTQSPVSLSYPAALILDACDLILNRANPGSTTVQDVITSTGVTAPGTCSVILVSASRQMYRLSDVVTWRSVTSATLNWQNSSQLRSLPAGTYSAEVSCVSGPATTRSVGLRVTLR